MIGAATYAPLVLGMAAIASCYGGFVAVMGPVTADAFGARHLGVNFGIMFLSIAVAALVGPQLGAVVARRAAATYRRLRGRRRDQRVRTGRGHGVSGGRPPARGDRLAAVMNLDHIDGLLLDMDGVLGVSWTPLDGAAAAVTRLHAAGVPLRVLTNTTALPQPRFGQVLREAGFPFADDEILTASVLAGAWLRVQRPGARVFAPRRRPGRGPRRREAGRGWTRRRTWCSSPAPTTRSTSGPSIGCCARCAAAPSSSPCTATCSG